MNDQMKQKLLEKLMDFLSMLPDKEESSEDCGPLGEGEKPKVEMLSIDAKPVDDKGDDLEKLKGLE